MDHLLAAPGTAERVLAMMGTADPYTPAEHLAELEAAGGTVVRYQDAEHGFVHDPSRPTHRPDDAADAWQRAIAWLTSA
jgi:carboxymethylenebutenolidase